MESNPFANSNHSNAQAVSRTTTTALIGSSAGRTASILNNAQNTNITGGSFNITVKGPSPLEALHTRAAPNAILNAGGRADEVRCHPGTREEVLGRIEKWRDSQAPAIFWLTGPAGAGKTAIVQTFAEHCKARGVPQANFFFFRTDPSRDSLSPLVVTLLHQLVLLYPALREPVAVVLSTNTLILDSILEDQLLQLIVAPLQAIQQSSSSYVMPVILIDGLDECESEEKRSQRKLIDAFDKVLTIQSCPFRLLVASRDESQIRAAFNDISSKLLPLYLDSQYSPEDDIQAFVNDEFKRVRKTHPLAHTLDATWPSLRDVEDIVKKSSGQFIYAATVTRFVMDSSASPQLSLARVQGAAQISSKSPFSYLDAIYTYILSRVDNQEVLKDILHAQLLIWKFKISAPGGALLQLLETYNPRYTNAMVQSCLADLTPIARYTNHSLLFYHASFSDYLRDSSRSKDYFVEVDAFNFKIQPAVWKACLVSGGLSCSELKDIALTGLTRLCQLPPGFLNALIPLGAPFFSNIIATRRTINYFTHIHSLCTCDDDVTKYKQILRQWIYGLPLERQLEQWLHPSHSPWPPCGCRYLAMALVDYYLSTEPCSGGVGSALRPETDSDTLETAVWLNALLHCIHKEKCRYRVPEYNRLVQKWTSWATWNDIPLDGVDDVPNAWWYLRRSRAEKWLANRLRLPSRT